MTKLFSNELESANLLTEYFSSVYSRESIDVAIDKIDISTFDLPNYINFSVDNIFNCLFALRGVKSVESDGLSRNLFFELRSTTAYPL